MKKFLLFLLVLIIALAAATQFLLPSYISSRIEKQLNGPGSGEGAFFGSGLRG